MPATGPYPCACVAMYPTANQHVNPIYAGILWNIIYGKQPRKQIKLEETNRTWFKKSPSFPMVFPQMLDFFFGFPFLRTPPMSILTHLRSVRAPRPAWSPEILCRRCLQRWDETPRNPSGVSRPVVVKSMAPSIERTMVSNWGSQIGLENPCDLTYPTLTLRKRPGTRLIRWYQMISDVFPVKLQLTIGTIAFFVQIERRRVCTSRDETWLSRGHVHFKHEKTLWELNIAMVKWFKWPIYRFNK